LVAVFVAALVGFATGSTFAALVGLAEVFTGFATGSAFTALATAVFLTTGLTSFLTVGDFESLAAGVMVLLSFGFVTSGAVAFVLEESGLSILEKMPRFLPVDSSFSLATWTSLIWS
jgi:hypothetical protein